MNSYKSFDSDTANAIEQCLVKATEQSGNDVTKQSGNALSLFVNDDVGCKVDHIPHTRKCLSRKKKNQSLELYVRVATGMDSQRIDSQSFLPRPKRAQRPRWGFPLPLQRIVCKMHQEAADKTVPSHRDSVADHTEVRSLVYKY